MISKTFRQYIQFLLKECTILLSQPKLTFTLTELALDDLPDCEFEPESSSEEPEELEEPETRDKLHLNGRIGHFKGNELSSKNEMFLNPGEVFLCLSPKRRSRKSPTLIRNRWRMTQRIPSRSQSRRCPKRTRFSSEPSWTESAKKI